MDDEVISGAVHAVKEDHMAVTESSFVCSEDGCPFAAFLLFVVVPPNGCVSSGRAAVETVRLTDS